MNANEHLESGRDDGWLLRLTPNTPDALQQALVVWMAEPSETQELAVPKVLASQAFDPSQIGSRLLICLPVANQTWPLRLGELTGIRAQGRDWLLAVRCQAWPDPAPVEAPTGRHVLVRSRLARRPSHEDWDERLWRETADRWRELAAAQATPFYWPVVDPRGSEGRVRLLFHNPDWSASELERHALLVVDESGETVARLPLRAGGEVSLDVPAGAQLRFQIEGPGLDLPAFRQMPAVGQARAVAEGAPPAYGEDPTYLARQGQYTAAAQAFSRRDAGSLTVEEAWAYLLAASQSGAAAPYAVLFTRAAGTTDASELAEALRRMPATAALEILGALDQLLEPPVVGGTIQALAADCPTELQLPAASALHHLSGRSTAVGFILAQVRRTREDTADLLAAGLLWVDADEQPDAAASLWIEATRSAAERRDLDAANRLLTRAPDWLPGQAHGEAMLGALEIIGAIWSEEPAFGAGWLRLGRAMRLSGRLSEARRCLERAKGRSPDAAWQAEAARLQPAPSGYTGQKNTPRV